MGGAAGAGGEAAAGSPGDPAQITHGGGRAAQQIPSADEAAASVGSRCHPGLPQPERSQCPASGTVREGASAADDVELKPVLIYHPEVLGP